MILPAVPGYRDILQVNGATKWQLVWWCGNPLHWFSCTSRMCLQQGSHWPSLPPLGSGWFNRLFVTQESGMALVLLLCPSWATSCYRSAPTHLLTHRSLQGVACTFKYSDIKKQHGRHINMRTYTQSSACHVNNRQIFLFSLQGVCVCVWEW